MGKYITDFQMAINNTKHSSMLETLYETAFGRKIVNVTKALVSGAWNGSNLSLAQLTTHIKLLVLWEICTWAISKSQITKIHNYKRHQGERPPFSIEKSGY